MEAVLGDYIKKLVKLTVSESIHTRQISRTIFFGGGDFSMYNSSASEVTTLWRYTNLFIIIIITLSYLAIFGVHDKTRQLRATRRYSLQMLLGRNLHANDALRHRSLHNDRDRKFLAKPKLQLSLRPLARPTPPSVLALLTILELI